MGEEDEKKEVGCRLIELNAKQLQRKNRKRGFKVLDVEAKWV